MFLQHTQDIKVVFDEEAIIDLLRKHVENTYYETKYGKFDLISSEIEITDDKKPVVKLRYQKVEKTIDSANKDENNE